MVSSPQCPDVRWQLVFMFFCTGGICDVFKVTRVALFLGNTNRNWIHEIMEFIRKVTEQSP